ncbi:hypothetical protein SEUCBS140593_001385 [Sporothrix eucalyptigena]|uniref:Phosphoglycerate mutase family protein n=1 Tax=Sporothrix eucalyptigena TaxID=1812306 RepID=A0ABP0AY59_9PEZI
MRIVLVRHGDAGSRDSALTAHGVLQTRRFAAYLAALPVRTGSSQTVAVTHIFSSDLQRAFSTASAVLEAQRKRNEGDDAGPTEVIKSANLRERDFRSGEGMRFGSASSSGGSGGRNAFADAETWDEMSVRAKRFIDENLDPLLAEAGEDKEDRRVIVVVAHGIILNVLLSMLLQRYTPSEHTRLLPSPAVGAGASDRKRLQLHVPWSNTGYLVINASLAGKTTVPKSDASKEDAEDTCAIQLRVTTVNCVDHLDGLKKTRGGIGSARFDPKQKTMDAFFGPSAKRQKRGGDA